MLEVPLLRLKEGDKVTTVEAITAKVSVVDVIVVILLFVTHFI